MRLRNLALAATLIGPIVAQQWQVVPPTTRMGAGLAYDSIRSRTVVFGGGIPLSQSPRDETFEFDGARWRSRDSVVVPPARWSSAMAFDSVRGRTILFGGYDFPQVYHAFDDTWEYDGSVWVRGARTSPPARPAPRHGHALAFDARRGRTVMFGGEVDGERAGDTWEYDGVLWTRTFTAHQPPARSGHGLVYDDARQRIVLFGGAITNGRTLTNDTWEYDGVDWTQVAIAAPPVARKDAHMAYDRSRRRTVLFGGYAAGTYSQIDDTWEYDGADWRQIHTPTAPTPRTMHGLCYDVLRGRTVLVGGWNLSAVETWEYDGADWSQIATTREPTPLGGYARYASAFDQARGRVVTFDAFDTWELTPPEVATFASHGTGCAGSAGVPVLAADPRVPPALGTHLGMTIAPVPSAPGVVLVAFGTELVAWRGMRLPLDFASPACQLWIGPESSANLLVAHAGRIVDFAIQIPSTRALVGVVIGTQALVCDAAAPNGIGALTNAGILRLY